MQGILTVAANTDKQKTNNFQVMDDNSAACWNQLSYAWLVENDCKFKMRPFLQFEIGLQKILSQLGVELQSQDENDRVEQFGH